MWRKLKLQFAEWLLRRVARLMPRDSWMFASITVPNTMNTRYVSLISDVLDHEQKRAAYEGLITGIIAAKYGPEMPEGERVH